jgi:caa(3)-type oxidase subunit IV
MADTHSPATDHDDPDHHAGVFKAYLTVFIALSVFTAVSFIVNAIFGIGNVTGAAIIMVVAVVKAVLVGFVFMHLKWDWYKLYFMIVPAFIIGTMMIIVLLPDIVLAWPH